MNLPAMLLCLCLLATRVACALDASLVEGLQGEIERIEPMLVEGVPITVQRFVGKDVAALARRIEERWRAQGSVVRSMETGDWSMRTRLSGTRSEVLQWRAASAPELLWSALDTAAPVQRKEAGLLLPAGCHWHRQVAGRSGRQQFVQQGAHCELGITALSAQLRTALKAQGWQTPSGDERLSYVTRHGESALLSLRELPGKRATWLTWLRVQGAR